MYREVDRFLLSSLPGVIELVVGNVNSQAIDYVDNVDIRNESSLEYNRVGEVFDEITTLNDDRVTVTQRHEDSTQLLASTIESDANYKGIVDNNRSDSSSQSNNRHKSGKFAYAYVISGCDNQDSCIGYIMNVLVASTILHHYNSTSDVVLLARMASHIPEEAFPSVQEEWLVKSGVKLQYIPKVEVDCDVGEVSGFGITTI